MPTIKKRFDNVQFVEALKSDPVAWEAFGRLGLRPAAAQRSFVSLVAAYYSSTEIFAHRKAELDELKLDLGKLTTSLRDVADEAEHIAQRRPKILARFPISANVPTLLDLAAILREKADAIHNERAEVAREFSPRAVTSAWYIAAIYYYCCARAEGQHVTFRDVAEVLAKGADPSVAEALSEDGIRKSLQRFDEQQPEARELLRLLIQTYIRTHPTGAPPFMDWMKAQESQLGPGHEPPHK